MATKSQNVLSSESKKQTISQRENDTNIDIIKKNKLQVQQEQQKQLVYQLDTIQTELNILDDDYMMSSPFRICKECGNDHSFKGNDPEVPTFFEGIGKWLNNNIKRKTLNETSY